VTCCYALQDKIWVGGPRGHSWEIYKVLADAESPDGALCSSEAPCCATGADPDQGPS
jgi:hypothetical protein